MIMETELQPFPPVLDAKLIMDKYIGYHAKQDFLTFVGLVAPTLISDWRMGKHIEVISNKLKELEDGKIKRLMVFLPPRSGEWLYDQMLELQVNGKQIKEEPIMLQGLDPRLQEEVLTLRSLMMSCPKKIRTQMQVEDTLRNGTQQD